jgi:hypothetical protein
MASYIQGLTDVPVPIAPFQPDFGMMQKALSTLQSRYEQGFASVKSAYNQVLNAPLSDSTNKTIRDGYIKGAEQKLKNLSSVDLSLPENQQVAENVFAPFWEDNMILQDASVTKWYEGELQRAQATRDSKDEKVRSQYSDAAVMYLQNGLAKLQSAGRDPNKYAQLEKRRFVPFQNMKEYLNEQASKAGLKVEWESAEGPYLVKREGGSRAATTFETFADNMLSDQFQDQFRVMGVVDKEERMRQIKLGNPLLTDEQAMAEVTKGIGAEYKKGLTSRTDLLQRQMAKITTDIGQYTSKPRLDTKQTQELEELARTQLLLKNQLETSKTQLSDTDAKDFQDNLYRNADSYFTTVMRQRAVKGWASARAGSERITSININPAWTENIKVSLNQRELDLKTQELALKGRQLQLNEWIAEHPYAKQGPRLGGDDGTGLFGDGGNGLEGGGYTGSGGGGYGGYGSSGDLMNPEKAGVVQSVDATNPIKAVDPGILFHEQQVQRWGVAHQELFDNRAGGVALRAMGVSLLDARNYMSALKNYSMDLTGNTLSKQDQGWLHDLSKQLTGKDDAKYAGFYQLRSKLLEKMQQNLTDKLKEGGPGLTEEDGQMLFSYLTATQAIQEHDALETQRKDLEKQQVIENPKAYGKILVNKNGKYDVSDVGDVVKDFRDVDVITADGEKKRISASDFATAYLSGNYNADAGWLTIGGKVFQVEKTADKWQDPDVLNPFVDRADNKMIDIKKYNLDVIKAKYGTSLDQKKLRDQLDSNVLGKLPDYQSQNGKLGMVIRYDLAQKGKPDVGSRLVQEAAQSGNHLAIYVNGELSKNDERNKAIMKLLNKSEGDLKDYVSTALLRPMGYNGRPTLQVELKSAKDSDKTSVTDDIHFKELAKLDKIEFELNPEAKGEMIQKIRYNSGMYVFGSLLKGKPLLADPILKAAGFDCTIMPDSPDHPTQAIVQVTHKEFIDGAYKDITSRPTYYNFSEITPDELVRSMYSFALRQFNKNFKAQQAYQQQSGQSQQFTTPQEVLERVRKEGR